MSHFINPYYKYYAFFLETAVGLTTFNTLEELKMRLATFAAALMIACGLGLTIPQPSPALEREVGFIIYGMPT